MLISGLLNGRTLRECTARATNVNGTSPASASVSTTLAQTMPSRPAMGPARDSGAGELTLFVSESSQSTRRWILTRPPVPTQHQHLHRHQQFIPNNCHWINERHRLHLHGDCYELSGNKLSLCGNCADYARGNNHGPTCLASLSGYSIDRI